MHGKEIMDAALKARIWRAVLAALYGREWHGARNARWN